MKARIHRFILKSRIYNFLSGGTSKKGCCQSNVIDTIVGPNQFIIPIGQEGLAGISGGDLDLKINGITMIPAEDNIPTTRKAKFAWVRLNEGDSIEGGVWVLSLFEKVVTIIDTLKKVVLYILSLTDVTNHQIILNEIPSRPDAITIDVDGGIYLFKDVDFTVTGDVVDLINPEIINNMTIGDKYLIESTDRKVSYHILTSQDVSNQYFDLIDSPEADDRTAIKLDGYGVLFYGVDFTVSGNRVTLISPVMLSLIEVNDLFMIEYMENELALEYRQLTLSETTSKEIVLNQEPPSDNITVDYLGVGPMVLNSDYSLLNDKIVFINSEINNILAVNDMFVIKY